jgi:lysozyme
VSDRVYVLDVSSVQKGIDWDRVVAHDPGELFTRPAGQIRGVVVKASEGNGHVDRRAREHLDGARAAGLSCGVYHFARADVGVRDAEREAEHVLRHAHAYGDEPGELPIVLDLEEPAIGARLGGPEVYAAWIVRWLDRVEAEGFRAMVYSAPVYGAEWRGASDELLSRMAARPLWVAQYSRRGAWAPSDTDRPLRLAPWTSWAMWQYSGGGPGLPGNTVPGVDGFVDLNLVNGGLATWRALLGLPEEAEEPSGGGFVHGSHVVDGALEDWRARAREE